jgi:hypothetical protein
MEKNYYHQYLKYKKKYLTLKKQLGGDVFFYVKPSLLNESEIMSKYTQITNQKIMIKTTDIIRCDIVYCSDTPKSQLIYITNLINNESNKTLEIEYIILLEDIDKSYIETTYTVDEINRLKQNKQPMLASLTDLDIKLIYKLIEKSYIVQNIYPKKVYCNKETHRDSSPLSDFEFEYLKNHSNSSL